MSGEKSALLIHLTLTLTPGSSTASFQALLGSSKTLGLLGAGEGASQG